MPSRHAAVLLAQQAAAGCREGARATLTREPGGVLAVGVAKARGGETCLTDASIIAAGSSAI